MSEPDDPYWNDHSDRYQYPNSTILRNIPNVKDAAELDALELNASLARMPEVLAHIQDKPITLQLWQDIHRILFQDIYDWAGEVRTVQLAKKGTVFAYPEHIESEANKLFSELQNENGLTSLAKPQLCERMSYYFSECNALHPFREGNGRTQKILFSEIARRTGHCINWKDLTPQDHLKAVIEGYHQKYDTLTRIFKRIMVEK